MSHHCTCHSCHKKHDVDSHFSRDYHSSKHFSHLDHHDHSKHHHLKHHHHSTCECHRHNRHHSVHHSSCKCHSHSRNFNHIHKLTSKHHDRFNVLQRNYHKKQNVMKLAPLKPRELHCHDHKICHEKKIHSGGNTIIIHM